MRTDRPKPEEQTGDFGPKTVNTFERGGVVSFCPIASAIGQRVLEDGGNAMDAAVATAMALAVTYPQAGNLGGGGLLMVHDRLETHCLDFRETAPTAAKPEVFSDRAMSVRGAAAAGVPSTVAGMAELLKRFGTWNWSDVVAPSVELAEAGVWITSRQAAYFSSYGKDLARFPATVRCFFPGGAPPRPGSLLKQPELGETMRMLMAEGPATFYQGAIADRIVASVSEAGGLMTKEDLAGYRPHWRRPARRNFFGHELLSAPLPSGGGFVLGVTLGLLESAGGCEPGLDELVRLTLLVRALRVAFALRRNLLGDPDGLPARELETVYELTERVFTGGSLEQFEDWLRAKPEIPALPEGDCTTHFCVLDKRGNAVSCTYSLNTLFGSKFVPRGTGILLNNTLDDFLIKEGQANWYSLMESRKNRITPGRRPVGSMSPTIALRDGKVAFLIGAAGGPKIPSLVAQVTATMFTRKTSLADAVWAPRVHHQFVPDRIMVEAALPEHLREGLARTGFEIEEQRNLGIASALYVDPKTGGISAVLDPRFSHFTP
jgi:gamma-glutamyltranspeptidase / glutathione hydrolase